MEPCHSKKRPIDLPLLVMLEKKWSYKDVYRVVAVLRYLIFCNYSATIQHLATSALSLVYL
jgi:hypothetical protein